MPTFPKGPLLIGLLQHHRDLRMVGNVGKEAVDVDGANALRECDLLIGRNVLIANHYDSMIRECLQQSVGLVRVADVSHRRFQRQCHP